MAKITSPSALRAVLLQSIEALVENRISPAQANAICGLSQEVHKSVAQEFEMRVYAAENLSVEHGNVIRVLEG